MSTLGGALVQIPYGELKKLEDELVKAKLEIARLNHPPGACSPGADVHATMITRLGGALGIALDVMGRYTAAVSPFEIRNLPAVQIQALIVALQEIGPDHAELCDTLGELVGEINACEAKRRAKPKTVHVATGADWAAGAEAFEREFGVPPSTYADGGLAGVLKARAAKEAATASQPVADAPATTSQPSPAVLHGFDDEYE